MLPRDLTMNVVLPEVTEGCSPGRFPSRRNATAGGGGDELSPDLPIRSPSLRARRYLGRHTIKASEERRVAVSFPAIPARRPHRQRGRPRCAGAPHAWPIHGRSRLCNPAPEPAPPMRGLARADQCTQRNSGRNHRRDPRSPNFTPWPNICASWPTPPRTARPGAVRITRPRPVLRQRRVSSAIHRFGSACRRAVSRGYDIDPKATYVPIRAAAPPTSPSMRGCDDLCRRRVVHLGKHGNLEPAAAGASSVGGLAGSGARPLSSIRSS